MMDLDLQKVLPAEAFETEQNEGDYIGKDGLLYCGVCRTKKQTRLPASDFTGGREISVPCICKCKVEENKRKEEETTLEAAIERIMSGVPINITSIYKGGRISIRQLSKESGIHESSIMRNHKEIYDKCMSIKYTSQEKIWFIKNSKSKRCWSYLLCK